MILLLACNSNPDKINNTLPKETEEKAAYINDSIDPHPSTSIKKDTSSTILEVMVVPCANGYDYAVNNYDFNPIIEKELDKFESIIVLPFPLEKLIGVPYQGVFDKKYCAPILEKIKADYLIMTRFTGDYDELSGREQPWGYETKILNTKTMKQISSIKSTNLNQYSEIEEHLKRNIKYLKSDIENLK